MPSGIYKHKKNQGYQKNHKDYVSINARKEQSKKMRLIWRGEIKPKSHMDEKQKKYAQEYRQRPEIKIRDKNYRKKKITELRLKTLIYYGGDPPKCSCCNEDKIEFLCLDHINGGGRKHRKEIGSGGIKFYVWLMNNNYPPILRVLCHNCNMAIGFYGYCPHKK